MVLLVLMYFLFEWIGNAASWSFPFPWLKRKKGGNTIVGQFRAEESRLMEAELTGMK